MTLPPFLTPDIVDAAEAAAQEPAKTRNEFHAVITALVVAFARFIVSIVALPLRGVIHVLVAERFATEEAKLRQNLLAEMQPQIDRQIAAAVSAALRAQSSKGLNEEKAKLRAELLDEVRSAQALVPPKPTYLFAASGGLLGGVSGGVLAWLWATHLSITPPELQAVALIIGIGACIVAGAGILVGCLVDAIRARIPKEQ